MALFTGSPVDSSLISDQKDAGNTGARADALRVDTDVKALFVQYTHAAAQGAGDGEINFGRLPAGRLRILSDLSRLVSSDQEAGAIMDIGHRAHTGLDGVAVVEDINSLGSALATGAGALDQALTLPANGVLELDSEEGIDIFASITAGDIATGDTIDLLVVYQVAG